MKRAFAAACLLWVAGQAWASPYDDGKNAFGRQEWRSAAALLGKFLSESPESSDAPAAAFLRGVALYQQGEFRDSLDAFQKLERSWPQSPFSPRLPYWKGTAALAAGQNALAERELLAQTKITGQEPFTTRALLNLALARVALGKSDAAIESLLSFTSTSSEPALLAQAWAAWGDIDRKAGRNDEALSHYKSARAANPGDSWDLWSRTQIVDLLISQARFDTARTELEQSADRFPAEQDRWDSRRIVIAKALGDTAGLFRALENQWGRESGRKKQELASNRARAAEDAGTPEALWWLRASQGPAADLGLAAILRYAFVVEKDKKLTEAAQALENWASAHAGTDGVDEVRTRAAQDRLLSGDPVRAVQAWDRLLADFPRSSRAASWLLARGRVRLDAGDTTRALADFSRLLKDYPKTVEAPEARYQTGLVYLKRLEPARAESWFYGLVQDLGSGELYQRALLARGISFVNAGKTDLARSSLQRLIREAPNGPWAGDSWAALGRNALQSSLFDEAVDAYSQAETALSDPEAKAHALWSKAEALTAQPAPEAASQAFARFAADYSANTRAMEARYRQGAVFLQGRDWARALEVWTPLVSSLKGDALVQTREGLATVLLRLGRADDGWAQMETLEAARPSPEAWYRWGLAATAQGEPEWAARAFQYLLQHHPESSVAEAALPRAADALLSGGRSDEALARYADYFKKFGKQASSAPVARAAGAGALAVPTLLEALVTASKGWNLAPEVAAEFNLVWAQSRLDSDTAAAQTELEGLSRAAPWASQRSQALWLMGRWQLAHGKLAEARTVLEAATGLGDDVSVFKAQWALAQVTETEGDAISSARQRESAEKSAGPGVPLEFRIQALKEAADAWTKAGRGDDAQRVKKRIESLQTR